MATAAPACTAAGGEEPLCPPSGLYGRGRGHRCRGNARPSAGVEPEAGPGGGGGAEIWGGSWGPDDSPGGPGAGAVPDTDGPPGGPGHGCRGEGHPHPRLAAPRVLSGGVRACQHRAAVRPGVGCGAAGHRVWGFLYGVSMFHARQGLFSVGAHAAASITLGLALMDSWDLGGFWLLLGLCSAPPAITELLLLPAALGRREKLSP
eukprot:XP_027303830.1 POU domain, class 4, transcription factor 1-like [Anas platyrhynchos]